MCVCKEVGGSRHEGDDLSRFFSVHSNWPQPRNRLQEQEKALDFPSASCSPNTPSDQIISGGQSPVRHQISMLIASGHTRADLGEF